MHRFIHAPNKTGTSKWLVLIHKPLNPPVFGSVFEVRTKSGRIQNVRIRSILRTRGETYVCSFESFAEARRRQVGRPEVN